MNSDNIPDVGLLMSQMSQGHPAGVYQVGKDATAKDTHRVFRIVIEPHTRAQYALWSVFALIIGISVFSFFLESATLVNEKMQAVYASDDLNNVTNNLASANGDGASSSDSNNMTKLSDRGSDLADGNVGPLINEYSYSTSTARIPRTSGLAYLVGDLKTGEIILERNATTTYPLASVSKLMTAVVAIQNMDMQKSVVVSKNSYETFGSEGNLGLGEKIKLKDLMYPLLIESSNDGAEVIADDYGRADFMEKMNTKSASLEMKDTYYEDPSGLNAKNVSTVEDQFKLARYIASSTPEIFDMTLVKTYQIGKHKWINKNAFLIYDYFAGGKNGFIDEAKKTTVSLFNVTMAKGGQRTICVIVLKSNDKQGDAIKLVDFLKRYVTYTPAEILLDSQR